MPYAISPRDRAGAAALSAALVGAIGWALVAGLAMGRTAAGGETLEVFTVAPPPPSPREEVVPLRRPSRRAEGRAAPPDIRSRAAEVVAPEPVIVLPPRSPVVAAPVAGLGAEATQGATPVRGPGTGAGGEGDGTGSGGDGYGDGGGWDETPPRQVAGLRRGDYPPGPADRGVGGTVSVRFTVHVDGRIGDCRVTRSSGDAELDRASCPVFERRFRYRPARDAEGPYRSTVLMDFEWIPDRDPAEPRRR